MDKQRRNLRTFRTSALMGLVAITASLPAQARQIPAKSPTKGSLTRTAASPQAQAILAEAFTKGPVTKTRFPLVVSKRLDKLEATYGKTPHSPAFQKELRQLINDIPYSPSTRKLFETAAQQLTLLQAAKDANQARQYITRLEAIQKELNKDVVYRMMMMEATSRAAEASRHRDQQGAHTTPPPNAPGTTPPPPPAGPVVAQTYPRTPAQEWETKIQPGDIILKGPPVGGSFTQVIYANKYDHCGIFMGGQVVFDSKSFTPYHRDGVMFRDLEEWKERGVDICILRDNKRSQNQVLDAVNWALNTYGTTGRTPYNFNYSDKLTNSSLYCSQLAWKIHAKLGIDLDSNDFGYIFSVALRFGVPGEAAALLLGIPPGVAGVATGTAIAGVAPDEIRASGNVNVAWEGRNR